jgi:hypothetical protein
MAGSLLGISKDFAVYLNLNGKFSQRQNGYYGNIGLNYKFATQPVGFYQRAF